MTLRMCVALTLAAVCAAPASGSVFDPRDLGAKPDGATLCTEAIQKSLDACAAAGGGTVRLAGGRFLSGTIHLRSRVLLEIAAGAVLLGSTNIAHYPENIPAIRSYTDVYVKQSLIAGEDLENTGLTGAGLIDGQGESFRMADKTRPYDNRPYLIRLVNCRGVLVEGLRLEHAAMWMQHYLGCERLTIRGIRVWNYGNANNDGLDLDGCRDCTVTGCVFESDDDAITLKSTFERPCERIVIGDCIARSHCNAIKMGTESNGGFMDITIANCVVAPPHPDAPLTYGEKRGRSGIALEIVDGGRLERVAISNITIRDTRVPLFLRLGDRARPFKEGMDPPPVGSFRDVAIANIVATGAGRTGCSISGLPGHAIENVSLSNILLAFEGGGARELATRPVPELPKEYPDAKMFGDLPAYGFYCRHVKGVRFSNVQLRTQAPDPRHAMAFDDAADIAVDGLDAAAAPGGAPSIALTQTRGALIRGRQSRATDGPFLKISGADSSDIVATGAGPQEKIADIAPEVPQGAFSSE